MVGGAIRGCVYMTLTEHYSHFQEWQKLRISEIIKQEITNQYADEPVLKHFTCPIKLCVMDIPIHTPSGIFYDALFIEKAERDGVNKIKDPMGNESFLDEQAMPDYERSVVIHKRSRYLIQQDIERAKNKPLILKTLKSKLEEIENIIFQRYERCRFNFEEARMKKQLTHHEYQQEIKQFEFLFGESADVDLDWIQNWPEILNERWVYFHPNDKVLDVNPY